MVFFKSLRGKSSRSQFKNGFFKPQLLSLETRLNPVQFTGNVSFVAGSLQLSMTSTGVGANANTVNVSNTNTTDLLFDVGAANTLVLTNSSPGSLVITGNSSNQVTVNFAAGGSISSLTLAGGLGQDDFTLGNINASSNLLNTATDFGITIDSASQSSGNIFDSLNIIGEVSTAGAGNFQTSNSTTSNQNLGQIDIAPTGSILALGGNVVLTANAQAGSSISISSGAVVQTGTGSITLTADTSATPLGKIFLAGSPVVTNGGSMNFNSGVVLSDNTTLNTGAASTGNITFQSTVDGNGLPPAENLTLQTAGVITFTGNIGTSSALGDLIINSQNPTSLKLTGNISANSFQTSSAVNGTIQIVGTQNYLTTTGLQLKTAGATGDVTFGGNITFANTGTNINVAHSGTLLIAGNVGTINDATKVFLGALFNETNVPGGTSQVILGSSTDITLVSDQALTFNTPVRVAQNATLVAGNGQGILFNSTVDGARTLSLITTGAIDFKGNIGSTNPVGQILTSSSNPVIFSRNPSALNINTAGTSLKAGVLNATIAGNVDIPVDQEYSGGGLSLVTLAGAGGPGNINLGKVTSVTGSVGAVSISNSGTLNLTKDIYLDGPFSQATLIQGFNITTAGTGYTSSPLVSLSGGGGTGAGATALLSISTLGVANGGFGYAPLSSFPVTISGGTTNATGTATTNAGGSITTVAITSIGGGYTTLTGLSLIGGTGSNATVNGTGFVSNIRVDLPGSGYTSTPTVTFAGGGGSGVAATAILSSVTGNVVAGIKGQPVSQAITVDTNNQDITFTSPITLNQKLVLDAGTRNTSDITLGALDSQSAGPRDLTIVAGGNLALNGSIGATNPLGAIDASTNILNSLVAGTNATVINAASLKANVAGVISIKATQSYTGSLDYSGSLTNPQVIGLNLTNTDSSSKVELGPISTTELATGEIASVSVTSGGNNYILSPSVSFVGGGGAGAAASTFLSLNNILAIVNGGSGFVAGQTVRILGGTTSAIATITSVNLVGGITGLTLQSGGTGFTSTSSLTISGGTGTGAVIDASGFVESVVVTNPGSGYTSAPTVNFINASGDLTGSGATGLAIISSDPTPLTINNAGPLYFLGDLSIGGPIQQIGTGDVYLGIKTDPAGSINISSIGGYDISFNGQVNMQANTTIDSNGGNVTFNQLIDGAYSLTINALGGYIFAAKQIGFNPVEDIVFNGASKISVLGDIFANSLTISNATGPVILSGEMDFTNTTGDSLNIATTTSSGVVVIQRAVNAPGNVIINNTGTLTISDIGDINLSGGSFSQTGTGGVALGGDITVQSGNISFSGPVTLTGTSSLKALNTQAPSTISFASSVNGLGSVSVESTGTILFSGNVGVVNPVGTLTIVNSKDIGGGYATRFAGSLNTSVLNIQNTYGSLEFLGATNIQNQIVTTNNIYNLYFLGSTTSVGGQASFNNGGVVRLSNSTIFSGSGFFNSAGTLEIGGIATFSGTFESQRDTDIFAPLSLNLAGASNKISGILTGSSMTLGGNGTLVIGADSPSYASTITINSGALQVSAFYNKAKVNINGGTLLGSGQILQATGTTGTLSPGASLGTLRILGATTLNNKTSFSTSIVGASPGNYGQLRASGVVSLGNSTLTITSASNLSVGQQVVLINKVGAGAVNGTFNGLAEGQSLKVGVTTFTISYIGGDGNDVVLTVTNTTPTPSTGFNKFFAVGTDTGGAPVVQINYVNGSNQLFYAYSSAYTGGVRVAIGDINGDGFDDLITGTGVGGGPHIKVFDLRGGLPVCVASFFAFEPNFTGGTYLATGNINGDGYADIIIGAGVGGGPRVKTYYGTNGYLVDNFLAPPNLDFFAYDPNFRGGVVVAAGDRDADGVDDIITGAGVGGGPNVRSFNAASVMIDNFFAFNPAITTGIFIAAGYVNGDSIADILVGTGRGTPTYIRAFYSPGTTGSSPTTVTAAPFTAAFNGGARPGVMQNPDGSQVFGVAAGPTGAPEVRALNLNLQTTDAMFAINPIFYGGVFLNTTL